MKIHYCCRECGEEVPQEQIDEDDVLYCPQHPDALIESVVGQSESQE